MLKLEVVYGMNEFWPENKIFWTKKNEIGPQINQFYNKLIDKEYKHKQV